MENNYCVRTRGLTKKYSKFTLGALDLDIPEGFSTALIGANGAGKTTLIDILCGVTHRTDGEVTYFGDSRDISDPNLRERIGYCASQRVFSHWDSLRRTRGIDGNSLQELRQSKIRRAVREIRGGQRKYQKAPPHA